MSPGFDAPGTRLDLAGPFGGVRGEVVMTVPSASRLAWSLFLVCAFLTCVTVALQAATLSVELPEEYASRPADMIQQVAYLLFPWVGALIASRRPSNSIGWLILGAMMVQTLDTFLGEYALRGLVVDPGSAPGAEFASWVYQWTWIIPVALLPVLFIVFPTGRTRSRAERWILLPSGLAAFLIAGPLAVVSWAHRGRVLLVDPDSIIELEDANTLVPVALLLFLASLIVSVISLLVRWRRSVGDERLQIKWLVTAGFIVFLDFFLNAFVDIDGFWRQLLSTAALLTVPIAIGVAILRYRLYDIDSIISRTLAYGALTAILAGSYLLVVLTLQSLLPLDDDSPLIVAVSTLGVVAAFGPLRGRVQEIVDRRFNRRRYDAERTIAAFNGRLRSEVELDALTGDLVGVVEDTMHPAYVSLWLAHKGAER